MDNIDGRKIPDPVREQIRFEAIENWLAGMTPTRLAHKYGTSRKIVYQWIDRYKTGGWEGLKTRSGSMDRFAFVDYLKSLVRSVDKPIIVITDGHPAHRAKFTKEYVEQEPRILGLHLLPGYSPELNPDEQVWNHLKEGLGKTALKTKEECIDFIRSKMKSLQKMPEAVKGFFRLHDTSYACRQCYL